MCSSDLFPSHDTGGHQARHTVVLPDGKYHSFSQFGSGTFQNIRTYLGPRMVVDFAGIHHEAYALSKFIGLVDKPFEKLYVHPDCLLTTPLHIIADKMWKLTKHGDSPSTCGLGIGEARRYWLKYGNDSLTAGDCKDRRTMMNKVELLKQRLWNEFADAGKVPNLEGYWFHKLSTRAIVDQIMEYSGPIQLLDHMPHHESVVFEGSQGVLLDEHVGIHPFTTWGTVTADHAFDFDFNGYDRVVRLGITMAID